MMEQAPAGDQTVTEEAPTRDSYWTHRRQKAAQLVADDDLTDVQIAAALGRSKKWLEEQKQDDRFAQRVAEIRDATRAELLEHGIAVKALRMQQKDERWRLLQQVRQARAEDPESATIPGGKTGLVIVQFKAIGAGRDQVVYREYAVDTATLAAELALEESAAKEMGEAGTSKAGKVSARVKTGEGEQRVEFVIEIGDGNDDSDD
jgi:hypothetical protein